MYPVDSGRNPARWIAIGPYFGDFPEFREISAHIPARKPLTQNILRVYSGLS